MSGNLYLIDAHALIFQLYHGIRDGMSSPNGIPTNAVFGFAREMLFLRQRLKPDFLVVCDDRSEPTFRNVIYPEYKANRDPMPNDLRLQIPLIHELLDALSIPVVSHPDYEADDIIATLARAGDEAGLNVRICSADKDCRQLINDRIKLYSLRKHAEFGRKELLEDWGIAPEQVVDLQTLVGDSVDNVKGVPGIGIKTAAKLLQEFGTLENILANIDKISGAKRKESLKNSAEIVKLSRRLVRLATDVPIPLEWDAWRIQPFDEERVFKMFRELRFYSLIPQVKAATAPPGARQTDLFSDQEELFAFGANVANAEVDASPAKPASTAVYHLVDTREAFTDFVTRLSQQKRFAVDLETTSLSPLDCELVGLAFAWQPGEAWYIAVKTPPGTPFVDPKEALDTLRPILEDPAIAKVNHNIKYDTLVFRAQGVELRGIAGDSMIAHYLLHSGDRIHNLDDVAFNELQHRTILITELIGPKSRKQPQLTLDQVDPKRVAEYSGEDAEVAWRLAEKLEADLQKPDKQGTPSPLPRLYHEVEVPLIHVLADMEFHGIRLDTGLLKTLSGEMQKQLDAIEDEIYRLAGHPFQISSLPQLRKVLFDELKLPPQKKTGTTGAASTDHETLEKLASMKNHPGHQLPAKILEYRQVAKLKSTYVDALPEMVNPRTGRVHASFNQTIATTGRLSSSDPNLQNIPIRREQGQQIRQAFLPAPGWDLLTADYSQIELRLLAHFCDDPTLLRAFAEERDIHTTVAAEIFNIPEDQVNSDQRRMAKTVNFGVIYGMSAFGLADRLHISREEASTFIDAYFRRYGRVLNYQAKLLSECLSTGYVKTILGRRRRIDGIRTDSTYQQRNQPEREAINMEIQGSAADLIKLAMLHLHRAIRDRGLRSRLLLQIHDELVFEVPPAEREVMVRLVRQEMTEPLERQLQLKVPLRVDMALGPNWLDTVEVAKAA